MSQTPPVPIHKGATLVPGKLTEYRKLSTETLIDSLKPGQEQALRARPDGTMVNGHHWIKVLRERGVDFDSLPREIVEREELPEF
jgi:hypothetical protein